MAVFTFQVINNLVNFGTRYRKTIVIYLRRWVRLNRHLTPPAASRGKIQVHNARNHFICRPRLESIAGCGFSLLFMKDSAFHQFFQVNSQLVCTYSQAGGYVLGPPYGIRVALKEGQQVNLQ